MFRIVIIPAFLFFMLLASASSGQSFYQERESRNHILTFGVGPSFAYLDNGGQYRAWNFEIKPSISAAYTKKLNTRFDLRGTAGVQWLSSGGNPSQGVQSKWAENKGAFTANGSAIYFDAMPSMNLFGFANHMNRSQVNLYGGFGIGMMIANTKQTKSFNIEEQPTNQSITSAYIPLRAGLSFSLGPYSDIAAEGTMFFTFTDNLDGNTGFNKYGDHLAQAQIVYRRYFIPRSKKD
jgi:hypothetical protein